MESLRHQLSETQDALHKKTSQFRDLRAKHTEELNEWKQEKISFDATLRRLEAEVLQLRQGNGATGSSAKLLPTPATEGMKNVGGGLNPKPTLINEGITTSAKVGGGGDDETVVISRSRMREAEEKFEKLKEELAEKTKLCESIQRRFPPPSCSVRVPEFSITDDVLIVNWEKLRSMIRALTLEKLNQPIQPKLVPEKARSEFEALTRHWKSYVGNEKLTCYIFRALIWRYLHTCLLRKHWQVWGKEHGDAGVNLANLFLNKASDDEYHAWRVHTLRLMHQTCKPDPGIMNDVTNKIVEATKLFATGDDTDDLKKKLSEIVAAAAEFSSIFGRSHYQTLMTDKPGSQLNYGFPYKPETMDVKGKLGTHTIVDLMVTPCLLKKDPDYAVLVKAEVIC
ncbi:uncharacterized protein GGS22DRAFT_162900 [Annulohypoxylon maeteangense]|uniref:uncharacterized protein n=1 Tax=Annulohypoxylon maeteangense TaxID=1927788 RepID=UPI0020079AEC|nr:uncharacterized protein GGS22DRAFT_162900 [Annulohypoxylon maeteangense]KAI0885156.1 hypothetical protein GGS22DRAFT_162900 [Annulohypoxylon maeteangense]